MQASLSPEYLHVDLTVEESYRVQHGDIIGDRINPINIDAKIEVRNLEVHYLDVDRDQRLKAGVALAELFSNEDLTLYIPRHALRSVLVPRAHIPKDNLIGHTDKNYLTHFEGLLPPHGILVVFGGSLRNVDLNSQVY